MAVSLTQWFEMFAYQREAIVHKETAAVTEKVSAPVTTRNVLV